MLIKHDLILSQSTEFYFYPYWYILIELNNDYLQILLYNRLFDLLQLIVNKMILN